jgi:hypothetical protein
MEAEPVRRRVLEVGDGEVGALDEVADGTAFPVRFVYGVSQPNGSSPGSAR